MNTSYTPMTELERAQRRADGATRRARLAEEMSQHAQQFAAHTVQAALIQRDNAKRFAFFAGAVAVGLLLALLYVGTFYPPTECTAPASELTGDPERMELESMQIRPERLTAKGVITI